MYITDTDAELRDALLQQHYELTETWELTDRKENEHHMIRCILDDILIRQANNYIINPIPNLNHLRTMLKLYHTWKNHTLEANARDKCFEKRILGYLLKLCHYWWVNNSLLVSEIMQNLQNCDGDLRDVIQGKISEDDTWHVLFRIRQWLKPYEKEYDAMTHSPLAYFLKHCNNTKMTFNGLKFADVTRNIQGEVTSLCVDCFKRRRVNDLLLVLQYGASVKLSTETITEAEACSKLLKGLFETLWTLIGDHQTETQPYLISWDYWRKSVTCGRILTRVFPPVTTMEPLIFENQEQLIAFIRGNMEVDETDPYPNIFEFSFPTKLKHLCRWIIREELKPNWLLPSGIEDLKLPNALKNYVNLLED